MKRSLALTLLAAWTLALSAAAAPKVGDAAPDFSLPGTDGRVYRLADFKGKQGVVLAWYPKAFTGGCTAECKALRDAGTDISKTGVALFAISVDDLAANKEFAKSLELNFPILSDPGKATAKAYGVLNANGLASRWTFYIGKDGRIAQIDTAVQPTSHGQTVAEQARKLGLGN